jgi:hypothetical protein
MSTAKTSATQPVLQGASSTNFERALHKTHAELSKLLATVPDPDGKLSPIVERILQDVDDLSIEAELYMTEYTDIKKAVVAGNLGEALAVVGRGLFEIVTQYQAAVKGERS